MFQLIYGNTTAHSIYEGDSKVYMKFSVRVMDMQVYKVFLL